MCREVRSNVGDACARELDCGPGQACVLDDSDSDSDGVLAATCQANRAGATAGAPCATDEDCRNGLCSLGRCTALCVRDDDCPTEQACTSIPRVLASGGSPVFSACLQAGGVLEVEHVLSEPQQEISIPVPSSARSFAVISTVDDDGLLVGADRLVSPTGQVLYQRPQFPEQFFGNAIRHTPAPSVSTLFVPNTPMVSLTVGTYRATLGSFLPQGSPASQIPRVRVLYKLDDARALDLHFYFLDLADHPCGARFDTPLLAAASAQQSDAFQTRYLGRLRSLIEAAGLELGDVTYTDITSRPELDGLARQDLGRLVRLGSTSTGINVFLVRSIAPEGIQALASGAPGPPDLGGTPASGIAVSMDVLCYREWETLSRVTAHAIARQMGLFHNREPEGYFDPIPDSDLSTDNLMFFGEFAGSTLSAGQKKVLGLYPGLR